MSAMSDYLEQKLIDHIFDADDAGNWTGPSTFYVELLTTALNDAGSGGQKVTGSGYTRVSVAKGTALWTRTSANEVSNAEVITFPAPTGDWGQVVAFAIYDHITNDTNLLFHGTLDSAKTINNGDPAPKFAVGQLKFTFN